MMKIHLANDCNCFKPYEHHYIDENKAAEAYMACEELDKYDGRMFWAIHLNGKHILNITED
jgi:hypothetical protein